MSDLPILEDTIRAAHRAAIAADNFANIAIRVSLKQRIAAGEALAAARELVPPDDRAAWIASLGISPRDAHRLGTFESQKRLYGRQRAIVLRTDRPEMADVPKTLPGARQQLRQLRDALAVTTIDRSADIARRADLLHVLFWDEPGIRAAALALHLEAHARCGQAAA
jgi:hypothetical protein